MVNQVCGKCQQHIDEPALRFCCQNGVLPVYNAHSDAIVKDKSDPYPLSNDIVIKEQSGERLEVSMAVSAPLMTQKNEFGGKESFKNTGTDDLESQEGDLLETLREGISGVQDQVDVSERTQSPSCLLVESQKCQDTIENTREAEEVLMGLGRMRIKRLRKGYWKREGGEGGQMVWIKAEQDEKEELDQWALRHAVDKKLALIFNGRI